MRRGDFAAAWKISDAVLRAGAVGQLADTPRHLQRVWDGTPLDGRRVLVRCYHGLGDTVQFVRYLPLIAAVARSVTIWVQPQLVRLVQSMPGAHRVLPLHDGQPGVDYDGDIEIMELPHYFRSSLETLPADVPYLYPSPRAHAEERMFNVGLVWRAGGWDELRSVPLALFSPLREIAGVQLHALQRGEGLAEWKEEFGPVSGSGCADTFAGFLQSLDLIVSVDSFPAHLAGALARPTFTLLHSKPDWRWMAEREDSPWYPTMRLFRQQHAGEWQPVIARVAAELRKLVSRRE